MNQNRWRTKEDNPTYKNQIGLRYDVARRYEEEKLDKVFRKDGCPISRVDRVVLKWKILADYGIRAGFFVTELWESSEIHSEQSSALWGTERVDIWEACGKLALIEANWMGAIVLKSENTG